MNSKIQSRLYDKSWRVFFSERHWLRCSRPKGGIKTCALLPEAQGVKEGMSLPHGPLTRQVPALVVSNDRLALVLSRCPRPTHPDIKPPAGGSLLQYLFTSVLCYIWTQQGHAYHPFIIYVFILSSEITFVDINSLSIHCKNDH